MEILPRPGLVREMLDGAQTFGSDVAAVSESEVIEDVASSSGVNRDDIERVLDAFFDTVTTAVGRRP